MLKSKQKIALARMVQSVVMAGRRLLGLGSITRVKRGGVAWELDLNEGIDFSIWLLGSFEPETVRCYQRLVKAGNVVLDIGANIGAHTLLLAKLTGETGKVIAFEPTDYAFSKLLKNRSLNPDISGHSQCMQYMLVDSDTQESTAPSLYSSWPLRNDEDLHKLHQGRLMTTAGAITKTLDSAIFSIGLDRVDCIKLDIDGFECGMLRGARKVLTRWHPVIIMELAPYVLAEQGASLEELIRLLKEYGYALYSLSGGEPLDMDAAKLQRMIPLGASLNVLARASSSSA